MKDPDPPSLKAQLSQIVEGMEDWQTQLVLSFVNTLFGSEPIPAKEQTALE